MWHLWRAYHKRIPSLLGRESAALFRLPWQQPELNRESLYASRRHPCIYERPTYHSKTPYSGPAKAEQYLSHYLSICHPQPIAEPTEHTLLHAGLRHKCRYARSLTSIPMTLARRHDDVS